MYTRYNALYAGYAWPVVKAAYGMVSAGQYMGRSCCCCSQPDLDTPNFPSRASSSSSASNTLLQVCRLSVRLQWLPCIWPKVARECPVSTHSILVVFFLTSSAAHFNAACGPASVQAAVRPGGPSKLSPQAGPGFKPRAGPVPGNARH